MFCGDRIEKEKVKIKTQYEKIVETDMDSWYYTYNKTVTSVRKKQCNVSSHKNNLQFAFKGPKYNIVFLSIFLQVYGKLKKEGGCFSHTEYL